MNSRKLSQIAGVSYILIFFAAIFANFFVLEAILQDPLGTIQNSSQMVRFGTLAFIITVVFDVVVAWALYELFIEHPLSKLSTYFRMMHAAIMGVAIFALPLAVASTTAEDILHYANVFNIIWLIGLFFFGIHLILLGNIMAKPKFISWFLLIAGVMYMVDTTAHFVLPNYEEYTDIFLTLVAIPSIFGEMAFTLWLLVNGGKKE